MYHITVSPDTYELIEPPHCHNPYIEPVASVKTNRARHQHARLVEELDHNVYLELKTKTHVPDMVFVSTLGLSLPRLPVAEVVLPNMRFNSRKRELRYAKQIFNDLHIKTTPFPDTATFEGQAEVKWFDGGRLLVVGYGFRASRESVLVLRDLLTEIYKSYDVEPPKVIGVRLRQPEFYHLDMAMLAYSPTGAIIHKTAFGKSTIERLRRHIGTITLIDTADRFCLNSIVKTDKIITPKLHDPTVKTLFEGLIGLPVVECDVSEFEKSDGSVASLVFDVHDSRLFTRKNNSEQNSPTSPKR